MNDNSCKIRTKGIPVQSRTTLSIRDFATRFRNRVIELRGNCGSQFPIVETLEMLGSPTYNCYSLHILPDNDPELDTSWAITNPSEKYIKIRESIYNDACKGLGFARFTVAHELGHFFMKHKFVGNFATTNDGKIPSYLDSEWQADSFAAELLMPKNLVENKTATEIRNEFGVSYTAAKARTERLSKEN